MRHGYEDDDFVQYRYNPEVEPPRLLAAEGGSWTAGARSGSFKRGSVTRLDQDIAKGDSLLNAALTSGQSKL